MYGNRTLSHRRVCRNQVPFAPSIPYAIFHLSSVHRFFCRCQLRFVFIIGHFAVSRFCTIAANFQNNIVSPSETDRSIASFFSVCLFISQAAACVSSAFFFSLFFNFFSAFDAVFFSFLFLYRRSKSINFFFLSIFDNKLSKIHVYLL